MTDNMDAMMADGLLHTVRDAAKHLYDENQTYPCDDVKRMMADVERLRAALLAFADHFGPLEGNPFLHEDALRCFALARAALNDCRTRSGVTSRRRSAAGALWT